MLLCKEVRVTGRNGWYIYRVYWLPVMGSFAVSRKFFDGTDQQSEIGEWRCKGMKDDADGMADLVGELTGITGILNPEHLRDRRFWNEQESEAESGKAESRRA